MNKEAAKTELESFIQKLYNSLMYLERRLFGVPEMVPNFQFV